MDIYVLFCDSTGILFGLSGVSVPGWGFMNAASIDAIVNVEKSIDIYH